MSEMIDPQTPATISMTFTGAQCDELAVGIVSDEMREYFAEASALLRETPAESIARHKAEAKRKRKAA